MNNIDVFGLSLANLLLSVSDIDQMVSLLTSVVLLILGVVSLGLKIYGALKDGKLDKEEIEDITNSIKELSKEKDDVQ